MGSFYSGSLGTFGELDVISKKSLSFAAFPSCESVIWQAMCTLLMQQVTRARGECNYSNPCEVIMSINNNSGCVE